MGATNLGRKEYAGRHQRAQPRQSCLRIRDRANHSTKLQLVHDADYHPVKGKEIKSKGRSAQPGQRARHLDDGVSHSAEEGLVDVGGQRVVHEDVGPRALRPKGPH